MEKTKIIEKTMNHITFNFIEKGPGHGLENVKKECNVNVLIFSSFLSL